MKEPVVLLHGLWRTCRSLARLQRELESRRYDCQCWRYASRRMRLAGHVAAFRDWLSAQNFEGPVHFVGHSMGGLIIRGALAVEPPVTIGRIVLIAVPNRGAGIAARVGAWPLSQEIFGLPLQDLRENSPFLRDLGVPAAEIGVISGLRRFHPLNPSSYLNMIHSQERGHDGTIELANTYLDGAADSIAIDANHTFICDHEEVIQQTAAFLENGEFSR